MGAALMGGVAALNLVLSVSVEDEGEDEEEGLPRVWALAAFLEAISCLCCFKRLSAEMVETFFFAGTRIKRIHDFYNSNN